jgi:hypothetical protein
VVFQRWFLRNERTGGGEPPPVGRVAVMLTKGQSQEEIGALLVVP